MKGNIVLAWTTSNFLGLDADLTNLEDNIRWAKKYSKHYDLGSLIICLSSITGERDCKGYPLNNYFIIFGRLLSWAEIRWHLREAYRFRIINK